MLENDVLRGPIRVGTGDDLLNEPAFFNLPLNVKLFGGCGLMLHTGQSKFGVLYTPLLHHYNAMLFSVI